MNEEISRNDLAADIERSKNLTLLNDRIIVLLDELTEDPTTASGIILPPTELQETDGGKLKARPSNKRHLLQGTVLNISTTATEKFKELGIPLNTNDRVYLAPQTLTSSFHFYPDRTKLQNTSTFNGFVIVPHNLIEAKF